MPSRSALSWPCALLAALLSLAACAAPANVAAQPLRARSGPYELELLVSGEPARTFVHAGETHVLGEQASRYVLRVHNRSGRRVEVVASVDGLDVLDGTPGDFSRKRGYLVPARGSLDIDGFRLSRDEVAAFRFSAVSESYAAKTGRPRNVGVIGVALFPERIVPRARPTQVARERLPAPEARSEPQSAPAPVSAPASAERAEAKAAPAQESEAEEAPASPATDTLGGASASPADRPSARRARAGLGTAFGEALGSRVQEVEFVRADPTRPAALLGMRYNDRAGLYALGIDVDASEAPSDLALRQSAEPFPRSSRRFASPPADWRRD